VIPILALNLLACSGRGYGNGQSPAPVTQYTLGGDISGLQGGNVTLQNNAANNLLVTADGSFTFAVNLIAVAIML